MKKLLVLTVLLVSLSVISYGQVIEKQTTYVLKMTEQEYNDYLKSKEQKEVVVSPITKVRVQSVKNDKKGSFGVTSGVSAFMGVTEINSLSYGAWLLFDNIGLEYNASAGSNMSDPFGDDYVAGRVGEWIAGGLSNSVGGFYKSKSGFYYGAGVQFSRFIGARNEKRGQDIYSNGRLISKSYIEPVVFDDKKVSPYITGGYMTNLGEFFTFKGGILASTNFSSLQVGVGYSF
jgi:hypothetical protein